MTEEDHQHFMHLAQQAKTMAYAPYSGFRVGACVVDESGQFALGCNMENASYGACLCAERNAIGTAMTNGFKSIVAIYITSDSSDLTYPCGICRQVLMECNGDMDVYVSGRDATFMEHFPLSELLPHAFLKSHLL